MATNVERIITLWHSYDMVDETCFLKKSMRVLALLEILRMHDCKVTTLQYDYGMVKESQIFQELFERAQSESRNFSRNASKWHESDYK